MQAKNGLYKYKGKRWAFIDKYLPDSIDSDALKACMIEELFEQDYSVFEDT